MNPEQEKKIRKHGEQLQAIFPATKDMDPVELCKKLRHLETVAHSTVMMYSNGIITELAYDALIKGTLGTLDNLLGNTHGEVVFINSDPRGYALKIDDCYMKANNWQLERDMGGFGILAPEIN